MPKSLVFEFMAIEPPISLKHWLTRLKIDSLYLEADVELSFLLNNLQNMG